MPTTRPTPWYGRTQRWFIIALMACMYGSLILGFGIALLLAA